MNLTSWKRSRPIPNKSRSIQSLVDAYKKKLSLNDLSIRLEKPVQVEQLSLRQAKQVQHLHHSVCPKILTQSLKNQGVHMLGTSRTIRNKSLHYFLEKSHRNSTERIEHQINLINKNRMNLFREGRYYRSKQRAKGAGVKIMLHSSQKQYGHQIEDNPETLLEECFPKTNIHNKTCKELSKSNLVRVTNQID